MHILVTGGNGFVGQALVQTLLKAGHAVRLPLRNATGAPSHAEVVDIEGIETLSVTDWRLLLDGCDGVVHAAGLAHIHDDVPEARYMAINAEASARLAEAASLSHVSRFVFLSSIRAQVGAVSDEVQSETTLPAPTEAYGRSKRAAEQAIHSVLPAATILRPALVVGRPPKANLKRLVQLARLPLPLPFGSFTKLHSVVTLSNLVDAVLLALGDARLRGGLFVVAEDRAISLADMIGWIREGMGRGPMLMDVPPALLALPLRLMGRADYFERLCAGLRVDARRLRQAGWRSFEPVEEAFRALGRRA